MKVDSDGPICRTVTPEADDPDPDAVIIAKPGYIVGVYSDGSYYTIDDTRKYVNVISADKAILAIGEDNVLYYNYVRRYRQLGWSRRLSRRYRLMGILGKVLQAIGTKITPMPLPEIAQDMSMHFPATTIEATRIRLQLEKELQPVSPTLVTAAPTLTRCGCKNMATHQESSFTSNTTVCRVSILQNLTF